MEELLSDWREKSNKLLELIEWLRQAERELKGAPKADPRWATYNDIKAAAERLEKGIETLEEQQEAELTDHLAKEGPLTLRLEDGEYKTVSAAGKSAGGGTLLPADLLRVWRVAEVFQGSVLLGNERAELRFGWREQLEALKAKPKEKKAKKNAVIGEESSLFGRE